MSSSLALSPACAPSVHSALGQVPDSPVSASYLKNSYIKGNHILVLQLFRIILIFKSWQTEQTDHEMTGDFPFWGDFILKELIRILINSVMKGLCVLSLCE